MAKIHVLKTWPEHWKAVESGAKTFDARKDDRDYAVGDVLVLRMFCPNAGYMRDAEGFPADISRRVTHLLEGGSFGIEAGHVVMSIAPLKEPTMRQQAFTAPQLKGKERVGATAGLTMVAFAMGFITAIILTGIFFG